jgi:hypothetical protein
MVKPISPDEAIVEKPKYMPDAVIDTWNRFIAKKYNGKSAIIIAQDEIVAAIADATGEPRSVVFDSGWLDIEDMYRSAGWKVEYDAPGFNESYKAFFTFMRQ